jgi:hypothetical protein
LAELVFEDIDLKFLDVFITYMDVDTETDRTVGLSALRKIGLATQKGKCSLAQESAIDAAFALFQYDSGVWPADLFVRPLHERSNN